MKKNFLLLSATVLCAAGASAQGVVGDAGTLTPLLPEGVTGVCTVNERDYAPDNIVVAGSKAAGWKIFFSADDGTHGKELWVSDGTQAGTKLVKDICPGASTSNIQWLTRFNDKVIFSATNGEDGQEVWISDGTEDGTYMVADVNMLDDSNPRGFQQLNETQFVFFAQDDDAAAVGQWWLYVSDGTEEGTKFVKAMESLFPAREDGDCRQGHVCRVGRKVFFVADASDKEGITYGDELWVTDGTEDGTFMVKDINTERNANGVEGSTNGAAVTHFVNYYNEKLFFKAWSWNSGNEVWATDGTEAGTYEIYDSNPTVNPDNVDENGVPMGNGGGATKTGYPANGYVWYRGYTPEYGNELALTNCEKGNYHMVDVNTLAPTQNNHSFPDEGCGFDGFYVFCCNWGTNANIEEPFQAGGELTASDGVHAYVVDDHNPGTGCTWVRTPVVAGGTLYFATTGNKAGEAGTMARVDKIDENGKGTVVTITNIDPENDGCAMPRPCGDGVVFYSSRTQNFYYYTYDNPNKDTVKNPNSNELVFEPNNPLHDAGINDVIENVTDANAPVEYFNIQGQRVDANTPGLYIRRQGAKAEKVIVK